MFEIRSSNNCFAQGCIAVRVDIDLHIREVIFSFFENYEFLGGEVETFYIRSFLMGVHVQASDFPSWVKNACRSENIQKFVDWTSELQGYKIASIETADVEPESGPNFQVTMTFNDQKGCDKRMMETQCRPLGYKSALFVAYFMTDCMDVPLKTSYQEINVN